MQSLAGGLAFGQRFLLNLRRLRPMPRPAWLWGSAGMRACSLRRQPEALNIANRVERSADGPSKKRPIRRCPCRRMPLPFIWNRCRLNFVIFRNVCAG